MRTKALLVVALLVALAACTTDDASVQIKAICWPTDDCTFASTCDAQLLGNPIFDPAVAGATLTLFLQVDNEVLNNADDDTGRVNTHDAHVDETVISGFGFPMTSTWIPAEGSSVVGVTFPPIAGLIEIQLRGYFDDGSRFETGVFPVIMETCGGCIPSCAAGQFSCPGPGQAPLTCFDPTGAGT